MQVVRALIAIVVIVALWRAYRWMIERGWLFDPHDPRRPMGAAAANALATIEGLYDPSAQHIVEFRQGEVAWLEALRAGIPDDPDPTDDGDSIPPVAGPPAPGEESRHPVTGALPVRVEGVGRESPG